MRTFASTCKCSPPAPQTSGRQTKPRTEGIADDQSRLECRTPQLAGINRAELGSLVGSLADERQAIRRKQASNRSKVGATASANLYSLVMSARANGLEPYSYLRHLFERLPQATTVEHLEALLPWSAKTALQLPTPQRPQDLSNEH